MKKAEIIFYAKRRGLCVYEKQEGRKLFYEIKVPIFTEGKEIPTSNKDILVRNIAEVKRYADKVWEDDKYKAATSNWLEKY